MLMKCHFKKIKFDTEKAYNGKYNHCKSGFFRV